MPDIELKKKRRKQNDMQYWHVAAAAVAITLGITFCIFTGIFYWHKEEARFVLRHAKDTYLAANVTAMDCLGSSTEFLSDKRDSGLSKEAEESIRELADIKGEFMILRWDIKNKDKERKMIYIEDDYLVYFTYENSSDYQWRVYRLGDNLLGDQMLGNKL